MKYYFKRIFSFIIAMSIFLSYSITAYALPKRLLDGTWIDVPLSEYGEEISYFIQYGLNQIGVFINGGDFETWLKNNEAYQDLYDDNGRLAKNISIDTSTGKVTYTKEIMEVLKNAVDEYAKEENTKEENGGFYLIPTMSASDVSVKWFYNSSQYRTFMNIVTENGVIVAVPDGSMGFANRHLMVAAPYAKLEGESQSTEAIFWDGHLDAYKSDPDSVLSVRFYDTANFNEAYHRLRYFNDFNEIYTSIKDGIGAGTSSYSDKLYSSRMNSTIENTDPSARTLFSTDGRRLRVFVSEDAAINYDVKNRKVYFTENYYNYVPEDLTVSIDDLQKSVDDLQKIIDELLGKIGNDTSEKEIEELLKQILEELRKNPDTGDGGGGGDVNVDIDLSTTNGLLSKILAKVTEIFDKISETATGAVDTVNTKLQETLDEILSTLKSIRRWSIADTVFDGVDALADVASFLKDFLTAPAAAIGTAASSLGETANMLTEKFPFSIPWDMAALVTLLSAEPQAPVFKLPITIESAGIEEYMEIDMSQFEYLSTIMRGMLSILYAYGILSMTTKVMDIGVKK